MKGKNILKKVKYSKLTAVSKSTIRSNLPILKEKLKKQGIEIKNPIAGGSYGIAYSTKNGKVLKITTDEDEASTSSKIINKKLKYVVDIYKVFSYTSRPDIYFILQEKLFPLSNKDEEIFKERNKLPKTKNIPKMMNAYKDYLSIGDMKKFARDNNFIFGKDKKLAEAYKELGGKKLEQTHPLIAAFFCWELIRGVNKFIWGGKDKDVFDFYKNPALEGAIKGIYEMYSNGITYTDNHVHNLMKDKKGTYKWIDLGYGSKAGGAEKIEKLKGYRCLL